MISNSEHYFRQFLKFYKYFYIEVINECTDYINMLLYYKINDKIVTKPSPVFGPTKTQRLTFPDNASNIHLRIFNSSFNPPSLICSKLIPNNKISRYKVIMTLHGDFECIDLELYD